MTSLKVLDWLACVPMQVRDSKVKFLKDEELGTVVHVHKPQKAQQQQQHQVGDQGYLFAGGACQRQLAARGSLLRVIFQRPDMSRK